jgi:hypothetical protein
MHITVLYVVSLLIASGLALFRIAIEEKNKSNSSFDIMDRWPGKKILFLSRILGGMALFCLQTGTSWKPNIYSTFSLEYSILLYPNVYCGSLY